jgi:conjugative relaxase-like TrwC/TraI family protein
VLGIHRVGAGRAHYYLSDLARELPAGPGPGAGCWAGAAAAGLGLQGPLGDAEFRAVLEGRHPGTGRPMASARASVAGVDLTFSAPKSASVLFALGGEEVARQVVAAHAGAVAGALAYLETHGLAAVRRSGAERGLIPTTGMVAGWFTHGVNRNHDPHLHSHVVMANLVHGADGRWGACDWRGVRAHRLAASSVYDAHLRAALTDGLGVRWTAVPLAPAEIAGVPPLLLGELSSRSADIRRHAHEVGARSAGGRRVAWAATRQPKRAGASFSALAGEWERRADAVAGGPPDLAPVLGHRVRERPCVDEHRYAGVLALAPHAGAFRRDVVTAFATAADDGVPAPALDRLVTRWARPAEAAIGVGEPRLRRADLVPAAHLLRALGPRPLEPAAHDVWCGAAHAIDEYRQRWGITHQGAALGLEAPTAMASLPTARLIDHARTDRALQAARSRLGWREPHQVELGRER